MRKKSPTVVLQQNDKHQSALNIHEHILKNCFGTDTTALPASEPHIFMIPKAHWGRGELSEASLKSNAAVGHGYGVLLQLPGNECYVKIY